MSSGNECSSLDNRPGGYAVINTQSRPWLQTPIRNVETKQRKSKTRVQVINNVFQECAAMISDPFWSSIFQQASIGKFPRKFSYRDRLLIYKRGSKVQTMEVPHTPEEAITACIEFFKKYGGIFSETDQEIARTEHSLRMEHEETKVSLTWSSATKNVQKILVDSFVDSLRKTCSLNKEEEINLRNRINVGIILGYFNKDNIVVENNDIVEIKGLLFDDVNRIFDIDPRIVPRISKSTKKKEINPSPEPRDYSRPKQGMTPMIKWMKMIDEIDKKLAGRARRRKELPPSAPPQTSSRIKLKILP